MLTSTLALFQATTASTNIVCAAEVLKNLFRSAASKTLPMKLPATANAATISTAPLLVPNFRPPVIAFAVVFFVVTPRIKPFAGRISWKADVWASACRQPPLRPPILASAVAALGISDRLLAACNAAGLRPEPLSMANSLHLARRIPFLLPSTSQKLRRRNWRPDLYRPRYHRRRARGSSDSMFRPWALPLSMFLFLLKNMQSTCSDLSGEGQPVDYSGGCFG